MSLPAKLDVTLLRLVQVGVDWDCNDAGRVIRHWELQIAAVGAMLGRRNVHRERFMVAILFSVPCWLQILKVANFLLLGLSMTANPIFQLDFPTVWHCSNRLLRAIPHKKGC